MRLNYFDNFRAIAICIIILGHSYYNLTIDTQSELFLTNLITGGTSLFVFISGFFLHRIFYKRLPYLAFMKKKSIAVGIPYLILSIAYMGVFLVLEGALPRHHSLEHLTDSQVFIVNLLTGRTLTAYWYIPFVLLLFLATPIFNRFIELTARSQFIITALCLILSCAFFWRPTNGLNPFHSLLYFTPFYLMGIVYSLQSTKIDQFVVKYKWVLSFLLLACVAYMTQLGHSGNYNKTNPFTFTGFDLMVPQKVLLILTILGILKSYLDREIKPLKFIAFHSFPLFFLHSWVLTGLTFIGMQDVFQDGLGWVFLRTITVIVIALGVSVLTQFIFKKWSRYLIGA